tara:strand:- start:43 stop:501 length:459 start_codon:yes stop_codon:yes gene_type:complete
MSDSESPQRIENIEESTARETTLEGKRSGTLREKLLIGTLAAAAGLWGFGQYQQQSLQASAAPLVEQALKENISSDVEAASHLTVARKTPLFGTPVAKVEVFLRKAGGSADDTIGGIEYEYALENGEWKLKNSGGCTSEACVLRGKDAFSKQ